MSSNAAFTALHTRVRIHAVNNIICHCHDQGINFYPVIQALILKLIVFPDFLVLDAFDLWIGQSFLPGSTLMQTPTSSGLFLYLWSQSRSTPSFNLFLSSSLRLSLSETWAASLNRAAVGFCRPVSMSSWRCLEWPLAFGRLCLLPTIVKAIEGNFGANRHFKAIRPSEKPIDAFE